jgi:N-methylhydantoinase A
MGRMAEAREVARRAMAPGARVAGPAAIVEDETTVIVPAGFEALCQPDGCLDVRRAEAAREDAA